MATEAYNEVMYNGLNIKLFIRVSIKSKLQWTYYNGIYSGLNVKLSWDLFNDLYRIAKTSLEYIKLCLNHIYNAKGWGEKNKAAWIFEVL